MDRPQNIGHGLRGVKRVAEEEGKERVELWEESNEIKYWRKV